MQSAACAPAHADEGEIVTEAERTFAFYLDQRWRSRISAAGKACFTIIALFGIRGTVAFWLMIPIVLVLGAILLVRAVAISALEYLGYGFARWVQSVPRWAAVALVFMLSVGLAGLVPWGWGYAGAAFVLCLPEAFMIWAHPEGSRLRPWLVGPKTLLTLLAYDLGAVVSPWLGIVVACFARWGLFSIGEGAAVAGSLEVQVKRDERALNLFREVLAGRSVSPFVLYLRPFSTVDYGRLDDAALETAMRGSGAKESASEWTFEFNAGIGIREQTSLIDVNIGLEGALEKTFRGLGPMLAFGAPGEAIGAGRLPAGEDGWKELVVHVARAAALIVVLPGPANGTVWEIRELVARGWLHKTCFLVPGAMPKNGYETIWNQARMALSDLIDLGEYHSGTTAVRRLGPPPTGTWQPFRRVPTSQPEVLAHFIQNVFPELPRWEVSEADAMGLPLPPGLGQSIYDHFHPTFKADAST